MPGMHTRGSTLNCLYRYLESNAPPDTLGDLIAGLPSDLQEQLGSCSHTGWYPAEYFGALNSAIASLGQTEDEAREHLIGAGTQIATAALNSFMRLMLRMLTPSLFARKFPAFWSRDNDFGICEISDVQATSAKAQIREAPVDHISIVAIGYVSTALSAITGMKVRVDCREWSLDNPRPPTANLDIDWSEAS